MRFGRGTWICKRSTCWEQFGLKVVNVEVLEELSTVEVRKMLETMHCLEESAGGGMGPGDGDKA